MAVISFRTATFMFIACACAQISAIPFSGRVSFSLIDDDSGYTACFNQLSTQVKELSSNSSAHFIWFNAAGDSRLSPLSYSINQCKILMFEVEAFPSADQYGISSAKFTFDTQASCQAAVGTISLFLASTYPQPGGAQLSAQWFNNCRSQASLVLATPQVLGSVTDVFFGTDLDNTDFVVAQKVTLN
eukprot:TRINITY_DN3827_c0_g1_i1.p1 TRINITY_DN3827_c0_g1~~TRINITY_DN3827_c0_g1_i1.p1  ORF type:complete len:200 (-),score=34.07 TRINITY_DN3827_c0_g1_i1:387-947(-)